MDFSSPLNKSLPTLNRVSVADPIKLFLFANEDFFRFFASNLLRLLHKEKN